MTSYVPPVRDVQFVLRQVLEVERLVDGDLVDAIIDGSARFAAEVIAPLNQPGDQAGCTRHADGSVTTPPGYPEAYEQYCESGWGTLALPEELGGQGLPHVLASVVEEFLNSACHGFHMYPGLTRGAVEVLHAHGSQALQEAYLPQLVSGEFLGTMALTEPGAGTDLGLIRTVAVPREDGSFALSGEKIFCSGGEHDLTGNIVHLVLAKLPDAPEGSRGISLFVVPKVLPDGSRNKATCTGIEHKMGLHGSATCAMHFDEAIGYLVGQPNGGLAAMFIMMNAARLSCATQGLAQAELAYQNAAAYALERRQGRAPGNRAGADPLIVHPDVRRMLMDGRALTEGLRALVLWTALQIDLSHGDGPEQERAEADGLVALLTPVLKAYGSDSGFATAVSMQQVFGGHGYVAEWGMEQIVRDARAVMLYEGANGVQALDLVGRKLVRDNGEMLDRFLARILGDCEGAPGTAGSLASGLRDGVDDVQAASRWLLSASGEPDRLAAGSYAFLQMIGVLAIGWMWLRMAKAADADAEDAFCAAKLATAQHYALRTLPGIAALRRQVEAGADSLMALPAEAFIRD